MQFHGVLVFESLTTISTCIFTFILTVNSCKMSFQVVWIRKLPIAQAAAMHDFDGQTVAISSQHQGAAILQTRLAKQAAVEQAIFHGRINLGDLLVNILFVH